MTEEPIEIYRRVLKEAWKDGKITEEEMILLTTLKKSLSISDETHAELEKGVKLETYVEAVRRAWLDGILTPIEAEGLEALRERFDITPEEHMKIESTIRKEIIGLRDLEDRMRALEEGEVGEKGDGSGGTLEGGGSGAETGDARAITAPPAPVSEDEGAVDTRLLQDLLKPIKSQREERLKKIRSLKERGGTGGKECTICQGSGRCMICSGTGECDVCHGLGKLGDIVCSNCGGDGKCTYCLGDGKCPTCHGSGLM